MADTGRWRGQAVSALNAWIGDHLQATGNPLHQPVCFFAHEQALGPDQAPAPNHGRVAVFVHGLGCNETLWDYPASLGPGSYPAGLGALGFTPLTVRYNTGRHIVGDHRKATWGRCAGRRATLRGPRLVVQWLCGSGLVDLGPV